MPDSLLIPTAVRAAFERIVDYAGLFPPARLAMEAAAGEYERERHGAHAWMLGRFVIPAAGIGALESALVERSSNEAEKVALAVLLDGNVRLSATPRTRIESAEIALRVDPEAGAARTAIRALRKGLSAVAPGLPVAVELPRGLRAALLAEAMDALAESGFAAKLRCGGLTADLTPSVEEVAAFIRAAVRARVPFKATAGLHHPVRRFHTSAGFVMHGFLNVFAAACFAPDFDAAMIAAIVAEEDTGAFGVDGQGLRWRDDVADETLLKYVRERRFLSFGSCSFREPVEDLAALRILPSP
ncbi:MAG TPA: hypothetical protein VIN40_02285 [Candidatus Tyrphobacter sp.]